MEQVASSHGKTPWRDRTLTMHGRSHHTADSPSRWQPRPLGSWRRAGVVIAALFAGCVGLMATSLALQIIGLEVAYVGLKAVAAYVALYTPVATALCAAAAVLSPSPRWMRRLRRAALVPAGLWVLSWMVILGSV